MYWLDEFKDFFSKYGKVVDHQIIRDHATNRPRGFGFIIFDSEQVVDDLLEKGNMIDLAGSQVSFLQTSMKDMALELILVCAVIHCLCFILVYLQHKKYYKAIMLHTILCISLIFVKFIIFLGLRLL